MSTEAERKKGREKFKRWYYKHRKGRPKAPTGSPPAQHRTYELLDPRDLSTKILGWGKGEVPWASLIEAQNYSNAPWAAWLRELTALDLEPIENIALRLGVHYPISEGYAKSVTLLRRREIATLRNVVENGPVGCLWNGEPIHFPNWYQVYWKLKIPARILRDYVENCRCDKWGRLWFDD